MREARGRRTESRRGRGGGEGEKREGGMRTWRGAGGGGDRRGR